MLVPMDEKVKTLLTDMGLDLTVEIGEYLEALAASPSLPNLAVAMCTLRFDESGPALREILARAALGEALSENDARLAFRGLHVLGGARDDRAFQALMLLLRRPIDDLDDLLGDAITETLPKIVAGVYDGDLDLLLQMIADPDVDEFVRGALFGAATFLAWEGRIDREAFRRFLERFDSDGLAEKGDQAWVGWQEAIALLGLRSLQPIVHQAFRDGRIDKSAIVPEAFDAELDEAERAPEDGARFKDARLGDVDDVLEELERIDTIEEVTFEEFDERNERDGWDEWDDGASPDVWNPAQAPVTNPLRAVGRNDPCPCGSGKKFKKCCLV
jgi:hypothetical protein